MTDSALELVKSLSPADDPFAGTKDGDTDTKLCIAIVGPPKTGKSWLACTAPKPIIFYDFDNRAKSLELNPVYIAGGIKITTLQDLNQLQPHVVNDLEGELENFKYRKQKGQVIPETVVFDSMSMLERYIKNSYMQLAGQNSYRIIKMSSTKTLRHAQGWDAINGMKEYMLYFIAEFRALMNVIVIFHERDEKDKAASTEQKAVYTGRTTINPQYLEDLLIPFNEVWRIDIADGSGAYEVQVESNYDFRATNTLGLSGIQPADIQKMLEKHKELSLVKG